MKTTGEGAVDLEARQEVRRPCHICRKELPCSEMAKKLKNDWDKYIYICKECIEKENSSQPDTEKSYFANKYSHLKGKNNWWD